MELLVAPTPTPGVADRDVEVVERKGLGHPDTICDALAEQASLALSRYYQKRFGCVLHHNVDKVLLVGGVAHPAFGAGEVSTPMDVYIAGRATLVHEGVRIAADELAVESAKRWLREHLHALDIESHVRIHPFIRPGSAELVDVYMRHAREGSWLANDTSCGVGYAPLSDLESMTLEVERRLNGAFVRAKHPQLGEDVKVMSVRARDRVGVTLACAMIGRHLPDLDAYLNAKTQAAALAGDAARETLDADVDVQVNAADDPGTGAVYLTVTGTSAESGDDGEAGRGNRVNGLITPHRQMTMESVAGKNPVTHVGKLYNIEASRIASRLVDEVAEIFEARCTLVSRIGRPVNEPQLVSLELGCGVDVRTEPIMARVRELVHAELDALPHLWKRLLRDPIAVF